MRRYTIGDIHRAVTGRAFDAGRSYQARRRVLDVIVAEDGYGISGRVKGSLPQPYKV